MGHYGSSVLITALGFCGCANADARGWMIFWGVIFVLGLLLLLLDYLARDRTG